ncbi:two-component regulator propeller domain-containing protein [Chryseolinea sp. T2]|uniref:two-component regulator propeller domain-containing protein n=1 Tax=Chryseolinea sp. T2 TaxID=3129255 RepID=UPI003076C002
MNRRAVLFISLLLITSPLAAQTIYFNNLGIDDGLRNGNVRAFVKDFQGFMWIGTEDGLHRYDGQSIKVYRKIDGDPTSLGSNFILSLVEDKRHNLWIGTLDGGLYVYRRKTDDFKAVPLPSREDESPRVTVRSMLEARDGYLYVGTDGFFRTKVTHIDSIRITKVPFVTDTVEGRLTRFVAIAHDLDSNLIVSVNSEGLFKYDLDSGKSYVHPANGIPDAITVYVDRRRKLIWTGSYKSGVVINDPANNRRIQIGDGTDNKTIRSNFVAAITGDATGNVWIAADNGLSLIRTDIDPFSNLSITTFLPGAADRTRIHGNIMKSAYVDRDDKVWIGTIYEGVDIYNKNALNFGSITIDATGGSGTGLGNVNALAQDKLGNIWIGLDGGGLYRYHGQLGSQPDSSLSKLPVPPVVDKIKALAVDKEQNLWIGTWGEGLFRYRQATRTLERIKPSNDVDMGTEIMALATDGLGNLWVGTFDQGLYRYTISNGEAVYTRGPDTDPNTIDRIHGITIDPENNVWIAKDVGGLNFLKAGRTEYHPVLTNHLNAATTVTSIGIGNGDIIWAGVPSIGLVSYNTSSKTSELYNESNGLANSSIHSIVLDSLNRLWISHNAGISALELSDHRFSNYQRAHGIAAIQFNNGSGIGLSNGQIAFGNIHGVSFFAPNEFRQNESSFPIVFTRFYVNNEEQYPGASSVLRENIVIAKQVMLNYDQHSFSVQFSPLRFDFTDDRQYEYMLEGFDKEWQPAGSRRLLSYTNLEPARYVLHVRNTRRPGDTSVNEGTLEIVIIPAWYQAMSFKIFLAGALVLLALAFHRLRIQFLIRQKKILAQKVEERTHAIFEANRVLQTHLDEINLMNEQLRVHQVEIFEKNKEIQTQNEELMAQHEHIMHQQESLLQAREQLQHINTTLEKTVEARTEQLNNTISNLNKTVFELDRFVYSASHDLSAPLKSINGLVQLINMEKEPAKIYEYTAFIRQTITKLEAVIKSMVDYARNTHVLVNYENVLLKTLVDEVVNELAFWQEASRFRFINQIDDTLNITTDRARIKVVLHNLVSNSIKYRDRFKDDNWIRFTSASTATYWELTLEDNGIGIRREYLDKVFNMYFRATDSSKGSGLGLFIVKETLAKVNGTIHVESELGHFTKFVIRVGVG